METFESIREAKEFLVAKIVEESRREGVALSEIEEKMLHFTETAWTLPDIWEVNEAFEREYESLEYEDKVAELIRGYRKYARQRDSAGLKLWDQAVGLLRKEDHYLLVMVDMASAPVRGMDRSLQLIVYGVVGFIVCAAVLMICLWFGMRK